MAPRPLSTLPIRFARSLAASAALACVAALGQGVDKPILYNYMEGDGGIELDRTIKEAYGARYTIVDTTRADGYAEPVPVAGEMPKPPVNGQGQRMAGYVLVVFVVTRDGLVTDPRVIKSTHDDLRNASLAAMAGWRFKPGTLRGAAIATSAAQEFTFGPVDVSNGYERVHIAVYQTLDILVNRMPPKEAVSAYVAQLEAVAHNFFVGVGTPETLHIVVVTRPGRRSRVWLVSSARPGNSAALEPLRKLLEAVPALEARGGPIMIALSGTIAGGDGKEPLDGADYRPPIPGEWRELAASLPDPPPYSSDAFLDRLWPDPK